MKKRLLIAAIAVFGITGVNAQDISFGVKAGVHLSNFGGDVKNYDMNTGLHIGVLAEFMFSEKFGLQPELLYSMQGASMEESEEFMGETYSYEENLKLDYISVPIMAKYYITEGFNIHAGPQIGFLVSANAEYEETANGETESSEMDIKDSFKSIDYGIAVGAGYQLDMGVFFNARYYFGLADISEDIEVNIPGIEVENIDTKNSVIQFSVGYKF